MTNAEGLTHEWNIIDIKVKSIEYKPPNSISKVHLPYQQSLPSPAEHSSEPSKHSIFQRATMSTQRAVVHKSQGVAEVRTDVPLPQLKDDYILVKTKAIALNPTDWKSLQNRTSPGAIVGCDYSGVVEDVGTTVSTRFKVGDRVAGFVFGGKGPNARSPYSNG